MHRKIDAFTDAHEHRAAVAISLQAPWRRFGGILVDMLYDHWLCLHWRQVHPQALPQFLGEMAELLADDVSTWGLPPPQADGATGLARLLSRREGLILTLNGIGCRLVLPLPLGAPPPRDAAQQAGE